jgi:hypothetical protein
VSLLSPSRVFPDRLVFLLGPAEIRGVRYSGGWKPKLIEEKRLPCDPALGAEPWQGAVEALKSVKVEFPAKATVVLANRFVRYAVVPWSSALGGAAEEEGYLRHHFAKIHGERAKAWALRASDAPGGTPRLASAIDSALIEAIKGCFPKNGKAKLVSVQPQLMTRFNEWRNAVPAAGAWLVLAEADRACVALHSNGRWRSVLSGAGAWLALLERERYRQQGGEAGELPNLVLLAGASVPADKGNWQFQEVAA